MYQSIFGNGLRELDAYQQIKNRTEAPISSNTLTLNTALGNNELVPAGTSVLVSGLFAKRCLGTAGTELGIRLRENIGGNTTHFCMGLDANDTIQCPFTEPFSSNGLFVEIFGNGNTNGNIGLMSYNVIFMENPDLSLS